MNFIQTQNPDTFSICKYTLNKNILTSRLSDNLSVTVTSFNERTVNFQTNLLGKQCIYYSEIHYWMLEKQCNIFASEVVGFRMWNILLWQKHRKRSVKRMYLQREDGHRPSGSFRILMQKEVMHGAKRSAQGHTPYRTGSWGTRDHAPNTWSDF